MKAVIINGYGDNNVLEFTDVEKPRPGSGQVLVQVYACGLNPVDYKLREGALQELVSFKFPRILGGDISGVIAEVGPNADDFKVGDEVFFSHPLDKDGGYAEYCVVDQKIIAKKPPSLSHVEAASLPVVGLTAIQALRDFGEMKPGSKVLIHAGAGGVGSFAIQYAKAKGAYVYTTASASKSDYVKSLGADKVIDYTKEDFVEISQQHGGMDIVFELVGGANYAKSILAVRNSGKVPCIVNPPDRDTKSLAEEKDVKTDFMLLDGNRSDLEEITSLVESGAVKTTVSKTLSFSEVKKGHEMLESGRTQGKLVLKVV